MSQHVRRQLDDVVRHDVVAAAGQRQGSRAEDEVDRGARAAAEGQVAADGAEPEVAGAPRGADQAYDVLHDLGST